MTTLRDGRTPAVFIDRDGVICENRPDHVKAWSEFVFLPGTVEALASLTRAKTRLFVFTNQSAVGRGLMSRRTLDAVHEKMLDYLGGAGAHVEGILVCPHHPDDDCACRKPKPGLLLEAHDRFKVDLKRSFVVGDHHTDVEAGTEVGAETVLVRSGRGADSVRDRSTWRAEPTFIADDLVDAAIWILGRRASSMFNLGAEVRLS
jgi:D-glycero-D-manno-heptose 1,7-bisphosphate phosphatase